MYELLKRFIFSIIGRNFIRRNEIGIRRIFLYPFFVGKSKTCVVCDKNLSKFILLSNNELLCPYCGSLKRNRRLIQQLVPKLETGVKVLEFSPSKCLKNRLKNETKIEYVTSDFVGEFEADKHYDITKIDEKAESYSIVICYHILEHIENDSLAMSELYRILKPDGTCFIQTPFKTGEMYEDLSITDPKERITHFGQHDHVRIYSVEALKGRLETVGFKVEVLNFREEKTNRFGFGENETVLLAHKN
jgi:SAM-dependent methyltransferase